MTDVESQKSSYSCPVVLVGGGDVSIEMVRTCAARGWAVVCADGGVDKLSDTGIVPQCVIGDMDSISNIEQWRSMTRVLVLDEQDTTDFEKCLYLTDAPFYLACGFTGDRFDHTLAALHVLQKYAATHRVVLSAGRDICIACTGDLRVAVKADTRFSIYPLCRTKFRNSSGLEYSLVGLTLEQGAMIGTSNRTMSTLVEVQIEYGAYAVILPVKMLPLLLESFNRGNDAGILLPG